MSVVKKKARVSKKRNSASVPAKYAFPVVIEKDEDGFFAVCPSLQGCYTQGDTYEGVLKNIKDVIELHVESRLENGEDIPRYEIYRVITVDVSV